jgi:hypothetical protein
MRLPSNPKKRYYGSPSNTEEPMAPKGIGRPNLLLTLEDLEARATNNDFTLHMAIEDLTEDEVTRLRQAVKDSLDSNDRKPVKRLLKQLMRARPNTNFKSGHKLIDALNDKPSEDLEKEP